MTMTLRYAGIAIGVLVFAVVLMVCGEGACGLCAHACCVRADRNDRTTTALNRVLAACNACTEGARTVVGKWQADLSSLPPSGLVLAPFAREISPLRI